MLSIPLELFEATLERILSEHRQEMASLIAANSKLEQANAKLEKPNLLFGAKSVTKLPESEIKETKTPQQKAASVKSGDIEATLADHNAKGWKLEHIQHISSTSYYLVIFSKI